MPIRHLERGDTRQVLPSVWRVYCIQRFSNEAFISRECLLLFCCSTEMTRNTVNKYISLPLSFSTPRPQKKPSLPPSSDAQGGPPRSPPSILSPLKNAQNFEGCTHCECQWQLRVHFRILLECNFLYELPFPPCHVLSVQLLKLSDSLQDPALATLFHLSAQDELV